MGNTTVTVTLNPTQQTALAAIAKGEAQDSIRPSTVQALIRRGLVEVCPDATLALTEAGHAFLDAAEPKASKVAEIREKFEAGEPVTADKGATSTKGKGSNASETPATEPKGRRRALGADGVLRKRIAPQLLTQFDKTKAFDKALAKAIAACEVESDGSVWLPVDLKRVDALTGYCTVIAADSDVDGGTRRAASACVRRLASFHRPHLEGAKA